jgi:subtilisin-like proprotein convertase family protein
MKKLLNILSTLLFLLLFLNGNAQITVAGGLTAQQLAEILAGSNITVTNAVLTGATGSSGSFGSTGGFPFSSGIILTNGLLTQATGPNNDPNTSSNLGGAGTAEMTALGGANSYDVVTLEFDFIVQSSSVQFQYIFASEEYPEFAPPNQPSFNDVFAFYISGPGIVGQENVALIPGTSNPVSIDNVNPVTYPQYYVDNTGGQQIQFDGYTTDLTAVRAGLTPCATYHLRFVLADIQTSNRNSAVFLKENSFVQENVLGAETQTINADGIALEGCVQGSFDFEFTDISTQDRTITFTVGGTAVNGVDYSFIDNYITIPAGETSGTVYINAFSDGLLEGAETVTLTYNSGVCVGTETVQLTINDAQPINFTLDGTNLDCYGDNSGEILVNATGGFPGYTYLVTDPSGTTTTYNTNPVTGLAAGQYSVQVNDTYGCKAEALVIGGQFNAGTTFLPDGSGVTYQAPLSITGFNPGQTITNVSQIQQICVTMEHSYLGDLWIRVQSPSGQIVTLKEQNGGGSCDLGEPIATSQVDGNSGDITPGIGYEYCFNASPVYGTMVNESGNFTRNYTDGVGNNYTDTYLPAGSYTPQGNFSSLVGSPMNGTWTVFVTDQFGQDNGYIFNWYISLVGDLPDTTIILTQPEEITISGIANNATCGSSNGSVNISALNGIAPLTYLWSNGATTEDISNVPAGQYSITVTDANGCSASETFIVNNIGTLALTNVSTPVTCFGGNDGSISVSPSGGTSPYTFAWSNSATTQTISGLTAGNYTVTITDQIGCIYSQQIAVGQNSQIVPTLVAASDEICNTTNGSINISANGGNGSFAYLWSNGASSEDIANLNSGSYSVTVTDGLGCAGNGTFTIANNLTGCSNYCFTDITSNSIVNSACGASNGAININILNAVAPYTISWNNGATTEDISGLVPGIYTVTVVDVNNCSQTASFTVGNSTNGLSIQSSSIQDETCGNSNGSINITMNGGIAPYSYVWSNGALTQDIQGLSEGTYSVNVTDNNGCVISSAYSISNNAGSLSVTGQITSAICSSNNGSITQTVTGANGAVSYAWSNGATTQNLSNLAAGTYACTYTDASGCSATNTYTVNQNSGNVSLTGSLITNETCNNNAGAINITVTGTSLTYLWSNGATTEDVTGLSSGNYSCTITNAQGCSINTGNIVVINSPGTMVVSNQAVLNEVCNNNNGSIDVNVYNGQSPFTYLWSNGATTQDLTGLNEGNYTLQISDNNGCSLAHTVTIVNSSGTLAVSNAALTHEACIAGVGTNGQGAIDLTVTGGTAPYTYAWSNGATTQDITGLSDGNYTVTINSIGGCSLTNTYTILSNGSNIAITSSSVADETCGSSSGSINVNLIADSGPYSYSWSNGATTEDLNGLSEGAYTLTVSNLAGCQISQTYNVVNDAGGLVANGIVTNENCGTANGAIDLTVNGGSTPYTYTWSNSAISQDLSAISAGIYTVEVEDLYGCIANFAGTVNNLTNGLSIQITSITNEVCGQGNGAVNITASATGSISYVWSNGATTEDLSNISGGTYSVTATDNLGCSVSTSATVPNQTGTLAISFSNVQNETCNNDQGFIDIEVSGTAPYSYAWNNLATSQDILNLSTGTYSVNITDGLGCILTQAFSVGNTNLSNVSATSVVTDAYCSATNGEIDLSVTSGIVPFTFAWNSGQTTEDITGVASGTYSVTITDGANCQTTINTFVGTQNSGLGFTNIAINNDFCNQGNGDITIFTGGTADDYFIDGVNNGGPNIGPLSAGTYLLTITDNFGCSVDSSVVLSNDAFFNLNSTQVDATCSQSNGSINLSVTGGGGGGGFSYLWSNGATTQDINNIPAGTYTVTVTSNGGGGGGCSDQLTVIVNNDVDFVLSGVAMDDYCNSGVGSIDQTVVSGSGLSYVWSNGATTEDVSGLSAGTYTCSVSFPGGCTETYDYVIGNTTNGTVVSAIINNEECNNGLGSIDLTLTGGTGPFDFTWTNSELTEDISNLSAGTYTVSIVDQNDGCSFGETFTVINAQTIFDPSSIVTNATCATCTEGNVNVIIANSSNYTFNWSNGASTEDIFGLTPGTYSVVITSAAGCDTTMSFTVLNTAGIEDVTADNLQMVLYPNPANTTFSVSLALPAQIEGKLIITDMVGKEIEERVITESGTVQFSTEKMNDGVYFVIFRSGDCSKMERLVISNK